jgi:hypothetical protein
MSHVTLVGPSAGLLVTFSLAALVGSPFTVEQLLVSISMRDGNGPHHCQSSSDLTEMLANYTYKSVEVMCAENYSVKQHCICMYLYVCQSVGCFTNILLAITEEILTYKLMLTELCHFG